VSNLNDKMLTSFLEASKVSDAKAGGRVFSVGPYGNRVAFAFQQARAFALAAGFRLWFDDKHPKEERDEISIAVLGGGVAGVTLMAALHSLGFTRLKLFERKSNVLMDQAYASHRLVHPSYNTWPFAEEHASTTRFPFLNWFAGPCDKVIAALRREWVSEWAGRFMTDAIQLASVVNDVAYDRKQDRVVITYTPYGSAADKLGFHYAFAAFGYGVEKATLLTEQTSGRYWNIDTIQAAVNDHEKTKFLCVGDGDGALIDCARLAYSNDVFDIAQEIMGALSSDAGRPNNIFDWKRTKIAVEARICREEAKAAESTEPAEAVTRQLKDFYINLVKGLSGEQRAVLDRGLIEPKGFFADRQVHLVGRSAAPFQPGTAPINKLILAHLVDRKVVTYHQGELQLMKGGKVTKLLTDDDCPDFKDFDYRVVRIGSEPPIEQFFKGFKADHKTKLVQAIGDFSPGIVDAHWFLRELNLDIRDKKTPGSIQNMGQKEAHIRKFLGTYCKNAAGHNANEPEFRQDEGKGVIVVSKHEELRYAAKKLGGYDWHVFGISLISDNVNSHRRSIEFGPGFSGSKRA
jgi:hypothetical protein